MPQWQDSDEPLQNEPLAETCTIDDFVKIDLRVARVVAAEDVPEAKKLLKLTVSLGGDVRRTVFAGIKEAYKPEELVGKLVVVVANLAPRKMKFGVSEGMVTAAGAGGQEIFLLARRRRGQARPSRPLIMRRTFLSWLTDRLILCPTRHAIEATDKTRRLIPFGDGQLEVWTQRTGTESSARPDLYVLKFPGTAGRAERSTVHPADAWPALCVELWSVNPPGYGGSGGTASLGKITAFADLAWEQIQREASGRPVLVTGNSLGCVSALYLAARRPIAGLILRNPPPLREVILARHSWWTLYLGARLIARQIPAELDAIRNATAARAPAVFVIAQRDRIVPPECQQQIVDAYQGPQCALQLAEADHHTALTDDESEQYRELLEWLQQQMRAQPFDALAWKRPEQFHWARFPFGGDLRLSFSGSARVSDPAETADRRSPRRVLLGPKSVPETRTCASRRF